MYSRIMEHKKFTVVVIAAVASLLLAGTLLAPIQSFAGRSRGGFPDTSSLKHGIRDGISVNLEHRDQHMNEENLCYRANTCRQSNVGQNTQGNDNKVTGFTDQSDNIQQAAAPVTNSTSGKATINNFTNIANNFTNIVNNFDCSAIQSNEQSGTITQEQSVGGNNSSASATGSFEQSASNSLDHFCSPTTTNGGGQGAPSLRQ
jgi:hypothetical protein